MKINDDPSLNPKQYFSKQTLAPRRHPEGTHLRFSPLVQAMFGILFCVNHYINLPSGTIFYISSSHNWSPILQKKVLGTIRGHLQLQAPKKHKKGKKLRSGPHRV